MDYEPLDAVISPQQSATDENLVREDREQKTNHIYHWEVDTGQLVRTFSSTKLPGITSLALSPDQRSVTTSSYDNSVRVWDVKTGQEQQAYRDFKGWAWDVTYSPDGRFVFDVFAPGADDIAETHGRWLEREPGIWERADWDERSRTLVLRVRGDDGEAHGNERQGARQASQRARVE